MRKKIFYFATIATMLLFVACNNEELPEANLETGRTLSLTASMPEEPTTRVTLEEDGLSIKLEWEVGDPIKILFAQGSTTKRGNTQVTSVSGNGKTATFTIVVDKAIDVNQPFNIYGVYGGNHTYIEDNETVELSYRSHQNTTLAKIKSKKDVMLYFKVENLETEANALKVKFNHLGSLFSLKVKNSSGSNWAKFKDVHLVGVSGQNNWAYNTTTRNKYNLKTNLFEGINGATNEFPFEMPSATLNSGASMEAWTWNPPLPGVEWPELQLEVRHSGSNKTISTNTKAARTPEAGKTYHLFAEWDGIDLKFVSKADFEGGPAQ